MLTTRRGKLFSYVLFCNFCGDMVSSPTKGIG